MVSDTLTHVTLEFTYDSRIGSDMVDVTMVNGNIIIRIAYMNTL